MTARDDKNGGYAPDCIDCPTRAECRAANDCLVLRQIRHPHPFARSNVEPPAHTDHPLRHFDRTCDACVAEEVLTVLRDAGFHDAADHLLGRRLRVAAPSHALPIRECSACGRNQPAEEGVRCEGCGDGHKWSAPVSAPSTTRHNPLLLERCRAYVEQYDPDELSEQDAALALAGKALLLHDIDAAVASVASATPRSEIIEECAVAIEQSGVMTTAHPFFSKLLRGLKNRADGTAKS